MSARPGRRSAAERPHGRRFALSGAHHFLDLGRQRRLLLIRPMTERDQVLLQPRDRVAQRPSRRLLGRPVAAGIVARRVALGPVGEKLDHAGPVVGAGALGGPTGRRVDGQEVVAVDPQRRQAVADRPRREGGLIAAGYALEGGDGPLVVDDVEDHRRAVDRGEGQGVVEVGLGGRPVADPGRRDASIVPIGGGHRPSHGLAVLGAEIARNREKAGLLAGIHAGHLAARQRVVGVGTDLGQHRQQRIAAGDQQALLAIGRKAHVATVERQGGGHGHRLLAVRLDVEGDRALALGAIHAVVVGAGDHHRAQPGQQGLRRQPRVPRPHGLAVVVQHPDQAIGQLAHGGRRGGDVGPRHGARMGDIDAAEIGRLPGPRLRLGDVQAELGAAWASGYLLDFRLNGHLPAAKGTQA